MKLLFNSLLLFSFLFIFACKAAKMKKDVATQTIDKLQEGMLLVKLKTSENKIAKYKEMGNMAKAKQAIEEQQTLNASIIKAFKNNFNFCPVYFFHSNDISNIKNNDFEGSVFQSVGEDLENPPGPDTFYLFGELDYAYQDELSAVVDGEKQKAGGTSSVRAIVIRNKSNFQIPQPFPYRVTLFDTKEKNLMDGVAKLNKLLIKFDNKMEIRKVKRQLRN